MSIRISGSSGRAGQTGGVHFDVVHEFPAPCAAVVAVLCDPAFHTRLDLPDLSRPEVVTSSVDGTTRVLLLRYEYIGQVDPIARRIVGDRKLTWMQELRLDTQSLIGTLSFSAEQDEKRLNGSAEVTITAIDDGTGTRRRISGDLHVRVPLVGGTAERRIVPGLVRRLDVEAAALTRELSLR
jgi:hypothetical protein